MSIYISRQFTFNCVIKNRAYDGRRRGGGREGGRGGGERGFRGDDRGYRENPRESRDFGNSPADTEQSWQRAGPNRGYKSNDSGYQNRSSSYENGRDFGHNSDKFNSTTQSERPKLVIAPRTIPVSDNQPPIPTPMTSNSHDKWSNVFKSSNAAPQTIEKSSSSRGDFGSRNTDSSRGDFGSRNTDSSRGDNIGSASKS